MDTTDMIYIYDLMCNQTNSTGPVTRGELGGEHRSRKAVRGT